jgi:uncharacterized protein (TIGR02271 family)
MTPDAIQKACTLGLMFSSVRPVKSQFKSRVTSPWRQCIEKSSEAIVPDIAPDDREESSFDRPGQRTLVIPVIEESLDVLKESVQTGVVRVHKAIREHEVAISEPLTSETVRVERIPKDMIVDVPPAIRTEGDVTVIPVLEEVLVTTKQLRLVEEVRITRVRSTNVHRQNVTLRAEDVSVDRQDPLSSSKAAEERLD